MNRIGALLSCLLAGISLGEADDILPSAVSRFERADNLAFPDFQKHVIPLLGKLGCSSAKCHGSFQGQGDFGLSLFGFDFQKDHAALTAEASSEDGHRINRASPTDSLIILKPTRQVKHRGKKIFEKDSWEYHLLSRWVETGAKGTAKLEGDPSATSDVDKPYAYLDTSQRQTLAKLEYEPKEILLRETGDTSQIRVIAQWEDGTREDVTCLSRFLTNDDAIVEVDASGMATSTGTGDTHIVVLYDNGVVAIPVIRPVTDKRIVIDITKHPNPVDRFVIAKLAKLGMTPSVQCSDSEFLRRVSIDMAGTLPAPDEVTAFLADQSADKRIRKINELLERPSYAAWWANKLCDFTGCNPTSISSLLEVATEDGYAKATRWYDWIYERIASNESYLDLVEGIMLADISRGAGQGMPYYWTRQSLKEPKDTAMSVAHSFLGIQLQCAECHKHPFDRWTQNDYVDFSTFFDVPMLKRGRKGRASKDSPSNKRELSLLRSHKVNVGDGDPRKPIMDWLRQEDNPWFARSFVNRVWAGYFSVGIVEPTDEFTLANPPSNPDLLDWLTIGFIESGYDMKWLHRQIASSKTYQRSWRPNETNHEDRRNYSRAIPRRIPAEIVYDAMKQATAATDQLEEVRTNLKRRGTGHLSMRMAGTHAMKVFGKPDRAINCDCERVNEPTLLQSIFLQNDPLVRMRLADSGWISEIAESEASNEANLIREAWLRSVNRPPSPAEIDRASGHLASAKSTEEGMTDLLWALMNTKEFILNH